jgi:chemotaxis-related protein WspB
MSKRLYILFSLAGQQFAAEGSQLREVMSWQPVQPLPLTPAFVLGVLPCRGQLLPCIDLSQLLYQQPCKMRLSTRILVATYPAEAGGVTLGLLAEQVTDACRRDPAIFQANLWRTGAGQAVAAVADDPEYGALALLDLPALLPSEWVKGLVSELAP